MCWALVTDANSVAYFPVPFPCFSRQPNFFFFFLLLLFFILFSFEKVISEASFSFCRRLCSENRSAHIPVKFSFCCFLGPGLLHKDGHEWEVNLWEIKSYMCHEEMPRARRGTQLQIGSPWVSCNCGCSMGLRYSSLFSPREKLLWKPLGGEYALLFATILNHPTVVYHSSSFSYIPC